MKCTVQLMIERTMKLCWVFANTWVFSASVNTRERGINSGFVGVDITFYYYNYFVIAEDMRYLIVLDTLF